MPVILEPVGLNELTEQEVRGWIGDSILTGKRFEGYSEDEHFWGEYGAVDLYADVHMAESEDDQKEIYAANIQVCGQCRWTIEMSDLHTGGEEKEQATKLVWASHVDHEGMVPIHILNADILPGFLEGDRAEVQMTAFAMEVKYFEDDDHRIEAYPLVTESAIEELNGKHLAPEPNTIIPIGLLCGERNSDGLLEIDSSTADVVTISGTIERISVHRVEFHEELMSRFLITRVNTNMGDIDIVHSLGSVAEEDRQWLEEGRVIAVTAALFADPIVGAHEKGLVIDRDNNLTALRYAMINGNAARLNKILAPDVVYESINLKAPIVGRDPVMEYLDYVHAHTAVDYGSDYAYLNAGEERVIRLIDNETDEVIGIVRIELDEQDLISRIRVTDGE